MFSFKKEPFDNCISVNSEGQFVLPKDFIFDDALKLNKRGCELIAMSPFATFNFEAVKNVDNSALAVIISWIRYTNLMKKKIFFVKLPQRLMDLSEISSLNKLIKTHLVQ